MVNFNALANIIWGGKFVGDTGVNNFFKVEISYFS
jgi:hypothetical protein